MQKVIFPRVIKINLMKYARAVFTFYFYSERRPCGSMCSNKLAVFTFTIFVSELDIAIKPSKYSGNSDLVSRSLILIAVFNRARSEVGSFCLCIRLQTSKANERRLFEYPSGFAPQTSLFIRSAVFSFFPIHSPSFSRQIEIKWRSSRGSFACSRNQSRPIVSLRIWMRNVWKVVFGGQSA